MRPLKTIMFALLLALFTITTTVAMYKMDYDIRIGDYEVKGIEKVNIKTSQELLSNICMITVPGMVRGIPLDVEKRIQRGDRVSVRLGYDGDLKTEFTGYLKAIYPNSPMRLECEDSMYLLRKDVKPRVLTNVTVKQIVDYVLSEVNPQIATPFVYTSGLEGYKFDRFVINVATGYEVLDKLRQETGLMIYSRGNEIKSHLAFLEGLGNVVTYDFERNIEDTNNLEYVRQEDVRLRVKIVGRTDKGGKMSAEVGPEGGTILTFQRPTVSDRDTLEEMAKAEIAKRSYDGYRGGIRSWLLPYCEVGYTAKVVNRLYPEREGSYYVQAVEVDFSAAGGVRLVDLGKRLI